MDPIHFYEGKWWFWDETWSDRVGPYDTEAEAKQKIKEYTENYLDKPKKKKMGERKLVLVCGDREWTDVIAIAEILAELPKDSVIIHGCARGADTIAGNVARKLGMEVMEFPANWKGYGRAAGPIRNRQMLEEGKPHQVFAFHKDINKSKGTKDMVNISRKANIPCEIFTGRRRTCQKK